jgi:two-component system nitrogen regulation response regulator GlnG
VSKLLVVDDEQSICWGIDRLGKEMGHEVATASSAERAFEVAEQLQPDVILLDVRLPGMDGLAAMDELRERAGDVPIIVMTAYGDLNTAVQAVRNGAFDYLVKPFDLSKLRHVLERAMSPAAAGKPERSIHAVEGFVATTAIMQEIFNRLALAAASNACVLLRGESGTGKELAARAIHKFSQRAEHPFVVVNIASLSETLAESELFGHVRGAFTGADQPRTGLLAQASGGTLFLDEVADIPLPIQVKLLRALEQREVVPVGSGAAVPADFRLISATHQDLQASVHSGSFRHDLYFRIAAFQVELPPLRDRRDDIIPLAEHFVRELADPEREPNRLSEAARETLQRRDWYGNVRELRNAVEHALIVARGGTIEPIHLPSPIASLDPTTTAPVDIEARVAELLAAWTELRLEDDGSVGTLYDELLALVEPPVLDKVLRHHANQFAASARVLGLHRTTLRKKIEQYFPISGASE